MPAPARPKLYHIVHVDRLPSIISDGALLCDATMCLRKNAGTTIGMSSIKQRRLTLPVNCRPGLFVGQCVPFYFCPRSVMLYLIYCGNSLELAYQGGQGPIVHLELDLYDVVNWAEEQNRRWAFTKSNAGARYFEDQCDLTKLDELDWDAIRAKRWAGVGISSSIKEGKQAEFLVEHSVPWSLVERIGVFSQRFASEASGAMHRAKHQPRLRIIRNWYY